MTTKIEWAGSTLNTVAGCTPQGPECANCYAQNDVHRFANVYDGRPGLVVLRGRGVVKPGLTFVPVNPRTGASLRKGARWTGEMRCMPHRLLKPLSSHKGDYWFVNSVSDLFHEHLVDPAYGQRFIAANFGLFAVTPHHRYQILTKQPDQAARWMRWVSVRAKQAGMSPAEFCVRALSRELRRARDASQVDDKGNNWPEIFARAATDVVSRWSARGSHEARGKLAKKHVADIRDVWPLPNVHLGVSVGIPESKHRIDGLRDLPAAVRFLSCEPLLRDLGSLDLSGIDWVIFGGESGPKARPCAVEWIRAGVAECRRQSVSVFVKQLGHKPTLAGEPYPISDKKGAIVDEWPEDLRIREMV